MDPHVNALNAKHAVTTTEIEYRTSGFSIPALRSEETECYP